MDRKMRRAIRRSRRREEYLARRMFSSSPITMKELDDILKKVYVPAIRDVLNNSSLLWQALKEKGGHEPPRG